MKIKAFCSRNIKELVRDPINIFFGIIFPLIILILLWAISKNIPPQAGQFDTFKISNLAPGIAVFGLSFISLFAATIISKDRMSSFFTRLFASPMTSTDFILGYTLPMFPIAVLQTVVTFAVSIILGLKISANIFLCIIVLIPVDIIFISLGLLFGSIFTDKQVGAVCGALLTNLTAWLSGIWFDISLVGKWFEYIAKCLPFVHATNLARAVMNGNYDDILTPLLVIIAYAIGITILAVICFKRKMRS